MKAKKEKRAGQPIIIDYENKKLSALYFIPLLLIAGFVPLIVYAKYVDLSGTTQALYWTGQHQYLDFFSYWKSRWVIAFTAIALIFYIILYKQKKLPFKNLKQYYIPLGIYAMFVIISTIFALDTQTALWGFVDMYQGMFVLLSYVLITFLTINFVNNERDVNLFLKAFLFLMIVEGVIGVGQYFGYDIFQTKIGNELILPNYLKVDNLSFSFGPKTIYGTLFNTNFVGSFATLMLPISIACLLSSISSKQKIISTIAVVLMIFTWIGCNSRAGYVGLVISFIFSLWLYRKTFIEYWKYLFTVMLVLIIAFIGLNFTSNGEILKRIKSLNIAEEIDNIKAAEQNNFKFEDIALGKNNFTLKTSAETLNFKVDGDRLFFFDEDRNELQITTRGNRITINDPRYGGYFIIIPDNYPGVTVNAYGKEIHFYVTQKGVKIIGSGGRIVEPKTSPILEPFKGLETLGSNRGYIWGTTIPMLKFNIIKGSGPDNYPLAFNQDDFIAKLNVGGWSANMVIDKPHNLYLQIAINTGMISLLAFCSLCLSYIFSSLALYNKISINSIEEKIGGACIISVIGYLVAGIFNDSVISVAPLFWLILGLGISINFRVKNSLTKKNQ